MHSNQRQCLTWRVLAICVVSAVVAADAPAQQRPQRPSEASQMFAPMFARATTPTDVASYTKFPQCLVIIKLQENEDYRDAILQRPDTLPPDRIRPRDSLPTAIATDVRRCAAKFTAASVFPDGKVRFGEAAALVRLLLAAGRDAEAEALVRQWIASVPPSPYQDSVIVRIATEVSQGALAARPRRLALAESMTHVIKDWRKFYVSKSNIMGSVWRQAKIVGADSMRQHAAAWYLRLPAVLRDSVFKGDSNFIQTKIYQTVVAQGVYGLYMQEHRAAILDSLQVNDQAYQRLIDAALNVALARRGWDMRFDRGTFEWSQRARVDTLKNVFYTYPAGAGPRPTPGKVGIVVRLDEEGRACTLNCPSIAATLRRVRQRFPEVEITLVAEEMGRFGQRELVAAGTEPAWEAAIMDSTLLKKYRLPGTFMVFKNSYVQLPKPDGRWIRMPSPNDSSFGGPGYYLVSNEGRIITWGSLQGADPYVGRESPEQALMETLPVLLARASARRAESVGAAR